MPKISVVMPVYNAEKKLPRSIESILNQTFSDFEFIIVNEFESDDGSREIVEKYAAEDSRIKLLQLKEHAGIGKSLNIGMQYAKGKYIARMDSDDYSHPERFVKQLEFMDSHSDYVLCGTAFNIIDKSGKKRFEPFFETDELLRTHLLFDCVFCHPTVIIRKSFFERDGMHYNEEIIAEDFDLWTRVNGKMANLPEVLLDYYDDGSGATWKAINSARIIACDIMKRQFLNRLKLDVSRFPAYIINPDLCEDLPVKYDVALRQGYDLLHMIEEQNNRVHVYNPYALANAEIMQWNKYLRAFYAKFVSPQTSLSIMKNIDNISFSGILSDILCIPIEKVPEKLEEYIEKAMNQTSDDMKIVVFGAGRFAKHYFTEHPKELAFVSCFIDSNPHMDGNYLFGKIVLSPRKLENLDYDWILISAESFWDEIILTLEKENVDMTKVSTLSLLNFCAERTKGKE